MNEYSVLDMIQSLWENIEMSHLAYLQEDENPMKLEERRRLEALIRNYLSLIPPQKKFVYPNTRQVLRDTFQGIEDFSCFNTVAALHGIATYAHNLLTQPWRKEFRTIKLYNGFYKHTIERGLIGGDLLLELMGYRKINEMLVFEDPIDPDRVAGVSKDTLIASVECQIIRSIYSEVFKSCKEITWINVFQYRDAYAGSEQEAANALIHLQTSYYNNAAAPFYQSAMYSGSQQSPYVTNHQVIPQQVPIQPLYPAHGYHYQQQFSEFYPTRTLQHPPSHFVTCPTGQLIEFDNLVGSQNEQLVQNHNHPHPHQIYGHHRRSSSDHTVANSGRQMNYTHHTRRPSYAYNRQSENAWGMDLEVYQRNNQGKAVGSERQTYCTNKPNQGHYKQDGGAAACVSVYKELGQNTEVDSSYLNLDTLEYSLNELWKDEDEVGDFMLKKESARRKKKTTSVMSTAAPERTSRSTKKVTPHLASIKTLTVNLEKSQTEDTQWNCHFCTYLNYRTKEVCIMCGKSKIKEEVIPLASGGRECPKCTLVNKRGATTCDVCETSLEHSPTYI